MNKIKAFLKKHKLTQKQLAKLLYLSDGHVQRLCTGKRNITKHTEQILEMLDKDLTAK